MSGFGQTVDVVDAKLGDYAQEWDWSMVFPPFEVRELTPEIVLRLCLRILPELFLGMAAITVICFGTSCLGRDLSQKERRWEVTFS